MVTLGFDAIHDNVSHIPASALVVLGYDTGTPDVKWVQTDWDRFPHARHVHIDQGFTGSPALHATVRDVETGAWDATRAVQDTAGWDAERPTIYCSEHTLPAVLDAGWKRDLWLVIPSNSIPVTPPHVEGCTVVAVQYSFPGLFDVSAVFDDHWPLKPPDGPAVQFPAPHNPRQLVNIGLAWDAVPAVHGRNPSGYTVGVWQLDGTKVFETVTVFTHVTVPNLRHGWSYDALIWANGGDVAPPGASLRINP